MVSSDSSRLFDLAKRELQSGVTLGSVKNSRSGKSVSTLNVGSGSAGGEGQTTRRRRRRGLSPFSVESHFGRGMEDTSMVEWSSGNSCLESISQGSFVVVFLEGTKKSRR